MYHLLLLFSLSFLSHSQELKVTVSGTVKDKSSKQNVAYGNVVIKNEKDSSFVSGTVTNDAGLFTIGNVTPGNYILEVSFMGYNSRVQPLLVGRLSEFLDIGIIEIEENSTTLTEVVITGNKDAVAETLDKKTFDITDNISQGGGSLLQVMKNLPGITVGQEGGVQLRGSSRVTILIDGKQTALTGFGNQAGLDNIPASAIERIEIINNPSAKFDANGMAGIINIIMKKEKNEGLNGKFGLTAGIGALREKRSNLPTIRPQYASTPKINPSLSVNYRKKKINLFLQSDLLSQRRLNKNEFFERLYTDGDRVNQQYQENRTQTAITLKTGFDWFIDENNSFTFSGLYSREGHIDRGDLPYFDAETGERRRLWQFYEDEVNTAITASASYQHKYAQPGHVLNIGLNYTFHREDEKYFITNILPSSTGEDRFKLIADQNVTDFNIDYVRPLRQGRIEVGSKLRWRFIPTNMLFFPGQNSPMDIDAAGWADYEEVIPAIYANYVFESTYLEVEAGLRAEYVDLEYEVNPSHNTYQSDGYHYFQPFPTIRIAYLINENNRLSIFYNRRVDRPDEGDIRIFPKYDDPEILKVGNPQLRPQFTQSIELGYKKNGVHGYLYVALYHRISEDIITRIITSTPSSNTLYSVFQNADKGTNTGIELTYDRNVSKKLKFNINLNGYKNVIDPFTVENKYPEPVTFNADREENYSGNIKINTTYQFKNDIDLQVAAIYLSPDIVPQGQIDSRYSVDAGIKKLIQKGKGELLLSGTDIFGTMRLNKKISSDNVTLISKDYYETQIIRLGYSYKF